MEWQQYLILQLTKSLHIQYIVHMSNSLASTISIPTLQETWHQQTLKPNSQDRQLLRQVQNRDVGRKQQLRKQEWKENVLSDVKKYSYAGKQYLTTLQTNKQPPANNQPHNTQQSQNQLHHNTHQPQQSHNPTIVQKQQQQIQTLQKQKQKLQQRNSQYLQENEQLTIKIMQLKEECALRQVEDRGLEELYRRIAGLELRDAQRDEELVKLKELKKALTNKCKQLIQQNQRICSTYTQHQHQPQPQPQCQHPNEQQLQHLKLTNQSQTITINTLQSALKLKEEELVHVVAVNKEEVQKLAAEVEGLRAEVGRMTGQVNLMRIQLEYKQVEYDTICNKLTTKQKQIQTLTQQLTTATTQTTTLNTTLQTLQTTHKSTLQTHTTKQTQLTQTITIKQQHIQTLTKKIEQLQSAHKLQSETLIAEMTRAHAKNVEEINMRLCQVQQQYKSKIVGLTHQHIELKSAMDKNGKVVADAMQALKDKNNKLLIDKEDQKIQIIKLKELNAKLTAQLEESQEKYRGALHELQEVHTQVRNHQGYIASLEEQVKQGQLSQRQLKSHRNAFQEQLQKVDKTYLQSKHELQTNIKFLTEQLSIWSQKYETLSKQNTSLQSQLQNYKSMYQILTRKHQQNEKNMQHSLISRKSSEKDCKMLMRQLESLRIQMQIMKEEKQNIQASLNHELEKRREMIECLIREKKILYGGIGIGVCQDKDN